MSVKPLLICGFALLALAGCKEEAKTDSKTSESAPAAKTSSAAKGQTVYFVCQMTSERVDYISEMIEMTTPRTNEEMARAFQKKVESLDRVQYPLGEGDTYTYTCTSDTDVRKMMNLSLDLRGMGDVEITKPFRSVTGWKP